MKFRAEGVPMRGKANLVPVCDPELQAGQPPANLALMRRVVKSNAEEDETDAQREMRKCLVRDPLGFMAELRLAEESWQAEHRRKLREKAARRAEKAAAATEVSAGVPAAVPALEGDDGQDRAERLCGELLGRIAAESLEEDVA